MDGLSITALTAVPASTVVALWFGVRLPLQVVVGVGADLLAFIGALLAFLAGVLFLLEPAKKAASAVVNPSWTKFPRILVQPGENPRGVSRPYPFPSLGHPTPSGPGDCADSTLFVLPDRESPRSLPGFPALVRQRLARWTDRARLPIPSKAPR